MFSFPCSLTIAFTVGNKYISDTFWWMKFFPYCKTIAPKNRVFLSGRRRAIIPNVWWGGNCHHCTYVSSLISPILTSQTFRIQICGAIEQLSPMVLWDMLYLKMSRFLSLVYKQEIFDYFMWMSPWRSGSMQVSHAEGPWFQSRSSSFFFFCNIFLLHKSLVFSFKFM